MNIAPDVHAILNALGAPAILLSPDYRILLANQDYEALFGDGRPLRGRRCYEVSHGNSVPCDLAGEHCPLKECMDTKQTARVLHVHHTRRGQEYVNVETWPVKGEDDEIMYFVEILRPSTIAEANEGDGLIGVSPAFQKVLGFIDRVAPSNTTVLLLGESGTGKEIMAQTIHQRSERESGPFVPVECTGLPEALFESELFGHVKGAFTGANSEKLGLVEAAAGGTLFLDEVGDIPLSDQVKLLRLLETHQFRRVGSTEAKTADFRLICATNKDLATMVDDGQFREDLYYRLNVFEIYLPPLRERREDILPLIKGMLRRQNSDLAFSEEALACLETYAFPGNIRELRNVIERASLMCDGDTILPQHLPTKFCEGEDGAGESGVMHQIRPISEIETEHIKRALRLHSGDRRSLAKKLGISERALYRKISALKAD
ncbi:MAG: sigma-54-dependent Fis family transcriptional regulator [Gammaproteobacteria bacterium]|nr:sigma-54-dependent Fis family transcriptional regulator [Gammaproteobacteria bacterium]